MPKLDGSVGQGAQNQRHDVAVVQAALVIPSLAGNDP